VPHQTRPLEGATSPGITPAECRERAGGYLQVVEAIPTQLICWAAYCAYNALADAKERGESDLRLLTAIVFQATADANAAIDSQMADAKESARIRRENTNILLDPQQPQDVKAQARVRAEAAHEAYRTLDPTLQRKRVRDLHRMQSPVRNGAKRPQRARITPKRTCEGARTRRPAPRVVRRKTASARRAGGDPGGDPPDAAPHWFTRRAEAEDLSPAEQLQAYNALCDVDRRAFNESVAAAAESRRQRILPTGRRAS
jgi:hypothetical protein